MILSDSLFEIVEPNKPFKVQPVDIFTPQEINHILDIKQKLYAELVTGYNMATNDRIVIAGGIIPYLVNKNPDSDIDYFILLGDSRIKSENRLHEPVTILL